MQLARKDSLNVLELAGKGRVVNSYRKYKQSNRIEKMDILSVDKDVLNYLPSPAKPESGMKTSAIAANAYKFVLERPFGYLPIVGIESPKYYFNFSPDHVHFHMITGQGMNLPLAEKFFASISKMLRKDGVLFLSADNVIFERLGQGFADGIGPFAALSRVLTGNFQLLFEHYRGNFTSVNCLAGCGGGPTMEMLSDARMQSTMAPEAKSIAASFGFQLKAHGDIVDFFSLFSAHVEEFGSYFVIAKKKE
ncbi:Uncharacterised protein [uncultured archaeon]|nr:Uncharacterised protein [uncultured archaeon]